MKVFLVALSLLGCGSVTNRPADGGIDAAIDASIDADMTPHLIFVTSTTYTCVLGGVTGADAICQGRAQSVNLPGTYKAWLADASGSPATRMTHHAGLYQLVTGAAIAQGWSDLTDGNLAGRIDRTEAGMQLGGVGCTPGPSCNFICAGGEVWSNVDGAGNRRAVADCAGWATPGSATAGNSGKVDVAWTAGDCTPIARGSTLPIFCVQQ